MRLLDWAQGHFEFDGFAVSDDGEGDGVAGFLGGEDGEPGFDGVEVGAVPFDDAVVWFEPGSGGGGVFEDALDFHAAFGAVGGDDADADIWAGFFGFGLL